MFAPDKSSRSVFRGRSRRNLPMAFSTPPFLPGCMGIAEEGIDAELAGDALVSGELGAVVEGDGTSQRRRQGLEHADQRGGDGIGL